MTHVNKLLIVSDFNVGNLAAYLNADSASSGVLATAAPYGQVIQTLFDAQLSCWDGVEYAVVWTRPEGVIEAFGRLLMQEDVSEPEIFEQVDQFAAIIPSLAARVRTVFFPIWALPDGQRGLGFVDLKYKNSVSRMLMKMNDRMFGHLDGLSNVYPLNTPLWMSLAGSSPATAKLWYLAKIPYPNGVFKEAAQDIAGALQSIRGLNRKLIVLDLDDTLWGGIIGDDGKTGIKLGGHDPLGESFFDFQKALKALLRRGILLGIVSKNDESVAMDAIESHPEMILRKSFFAGWRINWSDKAQNIADLARELNLGLQSVVFIDDNPVERDRVRDALPEVFVPEWPKDKTQYVRTLNALRCFDQPSLSSEDTVRNRFYLTERQRKQSQSAVASIDEWLKTLDMKVEVEALNAGNLQRTAQLLNKTNQMNLSTRRLTETELTEWLLEEGRYLWTFRVSDKFGDMGLTGICSLQCSETHAQIIDFVLSCRVMGRNVEEAMLHVMSCYVRQKKLSRLCAHYIATPKNKPCLDFIQNVFSADDCAKFQFSMDVSRGFPLPECIKLIEAKS